MRHRRLLLLVSTVAVVTGAGMPALAAGNPMSLVGAINPWKNGQFSNVAPDSTRGVAYLGSFDDGGVGVIDARDAAHPVLSDRLSTKNINGSPDTSDSADLDLVGGYLAVSHQQWSGPNAFEGISIYDTHGDPFHPALLRHISIPGGVHTVQIDPEVNAGRPYAYANSEGNPNEPAAIGNYRTTIVNLLTGAMVGQYTSPKGPLGCSPSGANCQLDIFAHEGFLQRHPVSGRLLDYISYWDAGLRIVDVTDPAHPVEKGAFDYNPAAGRCCAHYAAPTPSANWVYQEDEIGVGGTGGVHVLDTHTCDGVQYCTPVEVGFWHINGHPVQAAAVHGQGSGAFLGVIQRYFTWDAHNLDVKGENSLLVANYTMGIRLVDTTNKTSPVETAFYLPNANKNLACNQNCFFQGRETWGAYFQADGNIWTSDFWLGFFIVKPS
jgi:hypothetical protein